MPTLTPEQFANAAASTLSAAITTTGVTTLTVTSATPFPTTGNFRILVDSEIMLVTGVSGTTFTVTRSIENTTAATHLNGAAVTHIVTALALQTYVSGHVHSPRQYGCLAMSYDPIFNKTSGVSNSGVAFFVRIPVPETLTFSNILIYVGTPGATLTAGQNLAGIYTLAGGTATLARSTADQTTAWGTGGMKTMALTSALTVTGGPDTYIYVGNVAVGTTPPAFMRSTDQAGASMIGALTIGTDAVPAGVGASGLTALPASVAVSTFTASSNLWWIGLT